MDATGTPEADLRFTITIADTGETYACGPGQSLLDAMVALGRKGIPSGCHGGGCGVCKIKVANGTYETLTMSREHISAEEEAQGIVLACRTFPRSAIRLSVLGKMRKAVTQRRYGLV
ncbi:MAG: 2Fe-2S iron-sulfur cluster binding domain-containing protein [Rhodobacterales bacterium]|nr:2Fe-2S iron-sulfur cluster binding domain-containing protein [Rhodobacterales bacterium]